MQVFAYRPPGESGYVRFYRERPTVVQAQETRQDWDKAKKAYTPRSVTVATVVKGVPIGHACDEMKTRTGLELEVGVLYVITAEPVVGLANRVKKAKKSKA